MAVLLSTLLSSCDKIDIYELAALVFETYGIVRDIRRPFVFNTLVLLFITSVLVLVL